MWGEGVEKTVLIESGIAESPQKCHFYLRR
jgi:hypothetical protein